VSFVRRHKLMAALTSGYSIYLTLVVVGAIPAMVFPIYLGLVVLGAIPALTFPIYYTAKAKWWRLTSAEERETAGHVAMFSSCFGLLYVRGGINLASPAGRDVVIHQASAGAAFQMFLALFAAAMVWHRVWLFHKGRKGSRQ
jgi:uncharacterized membrane protein YqgA involved in biofilm formation